MLGQVISPQEAQGSLGLFPKARPFMRQQDPMPFVDCSEPHLLLLPEPTLCPMAYLRAGPGQF